jgi:hypothetical protein
MQHSSPTHERTQLSSSGCAYLTHVISITNPHERMINYIKVYTYYIQYGDSVRLRPYYLSTTGYYYHSLRSSSCHTALAVTALPTLLVFTQTKLSFHSAPAVPPPTLLVFTQTQLSIHSASAVTPPTFMRSFTYVHTTPHNLFTLGSRRVHPFGLSSGSFVWPLVGFVR